MKEQRRLSTIVFADITGYTSLMQQDEAKAMQYLKSFKSELEQTVPTFGGEIVQYFGDACLLSFNSTSEGVNCAIALQTSFIDLDIPIRMGIHMGEVIFTDDNVYGDGVNVASRIESMGVPGGILLSRSVRDQLQNKPGYSFSSLGSFEFKNIVEPLEIFALSNEGFVIPDRKKVSGKFKEKAGRPAWQKWTAIVVGLLLLSVVFVLVQKKNDPEKTSIPRLAIMDFTNEGKGGDQRFASGISEELNARLIGLQKIAVIARSSSLAYKDSDLSAKEIGEELKVDYILEGKIEWYADKKGAQSIRITPTLINVSENTAAWSGQFDREYDEVQSLQADITNELFQNLDVALTNKEQETLESSLSKNYLAYEAYRKGMEAKPPGHGAENEFRTAQKMFQQAISLDPDFSYAWLELGNVYMDLYWYGYDSQPSTMDTAMVKLRKAKSLRPDDPYVNMEFGDFYYRQRNYDKALIYFSEALEERPNDSKLLQYIAEVWRRQGMFIQAIETMEKGLSLDPFNSNNITELAWTNIFLGNFERALELQELSSKYDPDGLWNYLMGALIHWNRGQEGDLAEAKKLLENVPDRRSYYPAWFWIKQLWLENDVEGVQRLVQNISGPAIELQHSWEPKELLYGQVYQYKKQTALAKEHYEKAVAILEQEITKNNSDFRFYTSLGLAYAGLGNKEKAIAAGTTATKMLPLEKDHLLGLDVRYALMRIYAVLGEDELAMDVMSELLSVPCQYSGFSFTKNPEFAGFRNTVRFQDLMARQKKMSYASIFSDP